jgi:hypothetical protein
MRCIIAITLCITSIGSVFAQQKAVPEIKAVASRLKRLEEDVHREKLSVVKELVAMESEYAKKVDALYEDCLTDLNALLDKETKAGRLEYAVQLKEQISETELAREANRRLPQSPRADGGANEAVADPLAVLKGTTWLIVGQTYEFDGSATVKVDGTPKRCVVSHSRELIVFHTSPCKTLFGTSRAISLSAKRTGIETYASSSLIRGRPTESDRSRN